MEKLYTVSKNKTRSCSDHELLNTKFRFKFKKLGKTARLFRYDVNQTPYNYLVKVTNRFKGLDLIECLKNYGQRFVTLYMRQGSRPSSRKRNAKRHNGGLTNSYEKKRSERQRRKGKINPFECRIYPFECRVPKNCKER